MAETDVLDGPLLAASRAPESSPRERFGRMVAVLAHELRNPLASALAGVAAIHEMTDAADPRSPFLRRALDDLDRVSDLMERYLEFGRDGTVRRDAVDLGALARGLERRYRERVAVGVESRDVVIRGDAGLIERVLENLVDNALQAGATLVNVDVGREAEGAVVTVSDDGPGVARELRGQIFQPFVSGHGGSGLGLALARDVVAALGGAIATAPCDRGARFRLTFP